MTDILVPEVGESIESGVLTSWLKQDGDSVDEGDVLFELETDKATMEVPSTASGALLIKVAAGAEVAVGSLVAQVDEAGGAGSAVASGSGSEAGSAGAAGSVSGADSASGAGSVSGASVQQGVQADVSASGSVSGAGLGSESARVSDSAGTAQASEGAGSGLVSRSLDDLSPAVRRLVEELGLDPSGIPTANADGRLTKEDVQNFVRSAAENRSSVGAQTVTSSAAQARDAGAAVGTSTKTNTIEYTASKQELGARQERVPMTNLRKRIAERLVQGKQSSAQLTTFNEVNMRALKNLRAQYKDEFEKKHGVRLGFMSFFLKAAVQALKDFPTVNAFVDGTDIIHNYFYDISVAISSERGLITPVVKNVDALSFADIEATILDFAKRAQAKKILPNELMGGTFTISNGGVFGSMLSTPIPNPPQTAILGMHSIQDRPIVEKGEIVIAPIMYLALTYDHRILDGREAIGFLKTIKDAIEDPGRLLLNV